MRIKTVQLIIVILASFIIPVKGQPAEKIPRWALAIGYSPVYTFNTSPLVFDEDGFYPDAVAGRVSFRLSDRLSILSGVSTRKTRKDLRYDLFPDSYLALKYLEIPVQLNYSIHRTPGAFSPYIKFAIINSMLHSKVLRGPVPWTDSEYNLLTDFGIGTNLRITGSLSAVFEFSTGYFITYQVQDRAYFSGFSGLRYCF